MEFYSNDLIYFTNSAEDLTQPSLELWYWPEQNNFIVFYPGCAMLPQFITGSSCRRLILVHPHSKGMVLIDKKFCSLADWDRADQIVMAVGGINLNEVDL